MRLEFLQGAEPETGGAGVIRLGHFSPEEAVLLQALLANLASGAVSEVAVHELPFVEAAGGCRLTLRVLSWDQAVHFKSKPYDFECGFTTGTWDNVAGLVEPFTHRAAGFQWLAGGEAQLVLTPRSI